MQFSKPLSSFVAPSRGGKPGKPECKGYKMVITKADDTVSKQGNAMLVLSLDITEGPSAGFFSENPLKMFLMHHNDDACGRFKNVLKDIVSDNPGIFPEDVFETDQFDESKLVGLICGCVLTYDDNGYLKPHYLTTVERAYEAPPVARPSRKPPTSYSNNNPFA